MRTYSVLIVVCLGLVPTLMSPAWADELDPPVLIAAPPRPEGGDRCIADRDCGRQGE